MVRVLMKGKIIQELGCPPMKAEDVHKLRFYWCYYFNTEHDMRLTPRDVVILQEETNA